MTTPAPAGPTDQQQQEATRRRTEKRPQFCGSLSSGSVWPLLRSATTADYGSLPESRGAPAVPRVLCAQRAGARPAARLGTCSPACLAGLPQCHQEGLRAVRLHCRVLRMNVCARLQGVTPTALTQDLANATYGADALFHINATVRAQACVAEGGSGLLGS